MRRARTMQEDERETDGHADEHERGCEAPHFGYRHEPRIRQDEGQCRAREDDGDAQRKLPRENAHGLIVPGHVLLGLSRWNAGDPLAGRPVKSPVTSSSSVHSNKAHIFSSLSISGYARSASHFDTDCG